MAWRWIAVVGLTMATYSASAIARDVDRGAIAQVVMRVCMTSPMAEAFKDPGATCACGIGVLSARLDDRQFRALGVIAPHAISDPSADAIEIELRAHGFTEAEIGEMAVRIDGASDLANATCRPLLR